MSAVLQTIWPGREAVQVPRTFHVSIIIDTKKLTSSQSSACQATAPGSITALSPTRAQSTGAVGNNNCISAERVRLPLLPMSVLDMALNYILMRLQSWSFGEYGVPNHYHYYQVYSMGQIEIFDYLTVCKQMTNAKLSC